MNEISVLQIVKGFLTDVADVSWSEYAHQYTGKFPARLDSLYKITMWSDAICFFNLDEEKEEYNVRFRIQDETLYWHHDYKDRHEWDPEPKCSRVDVLRLADPKFFENFVQVICLNICEPAIFEFMLKRIIDKPKLRAICPETRMRACRRRAKYVMSCEEISNFIWKS